MSSVSEHTSKFREQRIAREKARIDKLRELNLKKYGKPETSHLGTKSSSKVDLRKTQIDRNINTVTDLDMSKRPITAPPVPITVNNSKTSIDVSAKSSNFKLAVKNERYLHRRSEVRPWNSNVPQKSKPADNNIKNIGDTTKNDKRNTMVGDFKKPSGVVKSAPNINRNIDTVTNKFTTVTAKNDLHLPRKSFLPKVTAKNDSQLSRKSFLPKVDTKPSLGNIKPKAQDTRKSILPTATKSATKLNTDQRSVFERLYQPKSRIQKTNITDSEKLQKDPNFLNKIIMNSQMIFNKRYSLFEPKKSDKNPPRRSISAVHFKRISKSELGNCIYKWSSIGEKLDKAHLNEINEDAAVREDKIVSAVKSERKRVKFQTPIYNFNTPKPEEMQSRLQNWLQKRGKSIDSYHHLQCFGIHHLARKEIQPLNLEASKFEQLDDENKENKPVESDSDNESFEDNMNNKDDKVVHEMLKSDEKKEMPDNNEQFVLANDKWRQASFMSDCVTELNESQDSMVTSLETPSVADLLLGALNDLTELLKEGYDWQQCARWLRAIRERYPSAPSTAAYWECRAALEEGRGDLPASVQCWEEAIAKGTERTVVEANLDNLLDKFMQLRISPSSGKARCPDPKLVDVKNVFKSTLIRFAVQQAKLRQSQDLMFTVTPVRRSARLSGVNRGRTPLQDCTSVHQAGLLLAKPHPLVFMPNDKLANTP